VSRRTTGAAGLAALAVLLTACGGGAAEKEQPKAEPTQVATDIAPPKPTSVQSFAGQGLGDGDTKRMTATITQALRSGNKKQFLSVFDPASTDLVAQQGTWFENVRKVPMKSRQMFLVKATDTRDSSGTGTLAADMGFQHQVTGADSAPLSEWYRYEFKKKGSKLVVTSVKGAPADRSSGEKYSRYYRQSWDDGPMTVAEVGKAIVLGPAADEAALRSLATTADGAIEAQLGRFARAKARLAPDVRSRKWVFMLQAPGVDDLFDYLGGRVKPTEANFLGFTTQVFQSDPKTGIVESGREAHRSRIVLSRTLLGASDVAATLRHEMTHALEATWQEGYGDAPRWAVEGTAVLLSDASASELSYRRNAGLGYLRGHSTLPTDKVFYDGNDDVVSSHYGAGYVACAYLAAERGEPTVVRMLRGLDDGKPLEKLIGMSEQELTKKARAWAS
jgi:hypothetical protein